MPSLQKEIDDIQDDIEYLQSSTKKLNGDHIKAFSFNEMESMLPKELAYEKQLNFDEEGKNLQEYMKHLDQVNELKDMLELKDRQLNITMKQIHELETTFGDQIQQLEEQTSKIEEDKLDQTKKIKQKDQRIHELEYQIQEL